MTVAELIEILKTCPQDAGVISHANNHTASYRNETRVALMNGNRVCIGNLSRRHVNHPNEYVLRELDGGAVLPDNWR
jgi:hypothetical protein